MKLFNGTWGTFIASCSASVVHLLVLAYIENPWLSIPAVMFNGLGGGFPFVAMILHVESICEPEIYTTVVGIMNAIYYGGAAMTANVAGGFVMNYYDAKKVFFLTGVISACWTVILIIYRISKRTNLKSRK